MSVTRGLIFKMKKILPVITITQSNIMFAFKKIYIMTYCNLYLSFNFFPSTSVNYVLQITIQKIAASLTVCMFIWY